LRAPLTQRIEHPVRAPDGEYDVPSLPVTEQHLRASAAQLSPQRSISHDESRR